MNQDAGGSHLHLNQSPIEVVALKMQNSLLKNFDELEKSLCNEYDVLDKKQVKITGMSKLVVEHVQWHNELRVQQSNLLGILYNIGKWGVIIYDQNHHTLAVSLIYEHLQLTYCDVVHTCHHYKLLADGNELANHLSRNNTLHDYKETDEESLIRELKKVKDMYDTLPEDKRDALAINMLEDIHNTVEKNSCLQKVQTKIYLSWCEIRISILRKLGLQDEFMSYNTLVKLQDQAKEGNEDAIKQIKTLWETMKKGRRGCNMAIWAQVLEALATHQGCIQQHIGHDWGHDSEVIKMLQDTWNLTLNTNIKDNKILMHLDRIVAHVMLHLMSQEGKTQAPELLLGGFMMTYTWVSFMKIERGIGDTLSDYYCMLHLKTHTMDNWSSVVMANIRKDPHFIDHGHNNSREKALNTKYTSLPVAETLVSKVLSKFLTSKRMKNGPKSWNLAMESQAIAGMMALHTTSWNWLSPSLKNGPRDIKPVIRAIAIEQMYLKKYTIPGSCVTKKVQILGEASQLKHVQEWVWWDRLKLGESQLDPKEVLKSIEDTTVIEQQNTCDRLLLEERDWDALHKFVGYMMSMPCVLSMSSPTSLLSADVACPLIEVIKVYARHYKLLPAITLVYI
ncbi:hypothetical protein EV424DRAFT_1343135 [Suillus variegatus]|nr:hypothetical protein EV424DRAFT_1343135 [Suillus variegatus]